MREFCAKIVYNNDAVVEDIADHSAADVEVYASGLAAKPIVVP